MGLRNLIQLKPKEIETPKEGLQVSPEERRETYHETGRRDSTDNNGHPKSLSISLDAIYSKFQNEEKENTNRQNELKKTYIDQKEAKNSEIKGLEVATENTNESIQHHDEEISVKNEKIKELRNEVKDIPQNPELYVADVKRGASTKFWIGVIVLAPLTFYLFTFYASVVYSAMEKVFTYTDQRWYMPDAIAKASEDGAQALATVIFAPFIFIGLGYLIHMFYQKKNWMAYLKLTGIIGTTLIFDILLAFFIEKKLWELNVVDEGAVYGFKEAVESQEFWLIIFLGFVAYLIWGFIFDFVMEEHKNRDKIKIEIRKRQSKIQDCREDIEMLENKIGESKQLILNFKAEIQAARGRISELQSILDGIVIPTKEYKLYASEYVQGWVTYIAEHISVSKAVNDKMINEAHQVYEEHLKDVGANDNFQNTIFTQTL
jgi:predicted  nucleic acid-binding Zn-ribbon protein